MKLKEYQGKELFKKYGLNFSKKKLIKDNNVNNKSDIFIFLFFKICPFPIYKCDLCHNWNYSFHIN